MLGKTEMRIFMLGKNKMWILMFGKTKLKILLFGKIEMWRRGKVVAVVIDREGRWLCR